jgi:4-hydroxy-3-polyprenylbenzoate decarboxylase
LRDHLAVKGIKRVVMHEPLTNVRPVIFLNFARETPRTEVWRGLHGAATLQAQCGKIVIALGEDIDASNTDAVLWSMAYRSNLSEDVHIAPYRSGGHGPKSGPRSSDSTLLIDATPKHPMPPFALPAREYMERAKVMWDELGLPALSPQPPWYGYSLGDWNETWDIWAKRAVEGKWEETGKDTFARRKGGVIPETPVRSVDKGKKE